MEPEELSEVGEVAATAIGQLEEMMPEGATVRAALMIVELQFDCDNCGEVHEFCFTHTNTDSTAHKRGLLYEALDSIDAAHMPVDTGEPHDDD